MRKRLTAAISLIVCLLALAGLAAPAAQDRPDDLSIMSFNIRYGTAKDGAHAWPKRRGLVMDVLRTREPDIVGLQEALRFQLDELHQALPHYDEIGVGRSDGKAKGEYAAILYDRDRLAVEAHGTFWLSETPEQPGSMHWGNRIPRICTWARFTNRRSERAFYVYNVHLDHESQPSREKSTLLLAQRMAGRAHRADPVIVTGDFNAGEDNPAIRYLKGELPCVDPGRKGDPAPAPAEPPPITLSDTFRVIHPDAATVGTFNGFKGTRDGAKIDYVFVEPGVKVLDAAIVTDNENGRYPSDHFPVTARLRLPGEDQRR